MLIKIIFFEKFIVDIDLYMFDDIKKEKDLVNLIFKKKNLIK